jgi:hypothetical protein
MPRTDGLADGTDIIQGVRTYDAIAGTWTTPDAYAGNVDDPASQKSYMWNENNPEGYSDPTGYCPGCPVPGTEDQDGGQGGDDTGSGIGQMLVAVGAPEGDASHVAQEFTDFQKVVNNPCLSGAGVAECQEAGREAARAYPGDRTHERADYIYRDPLTHEIDYVKLGPDQGWGDDHGVKSSEMPLPWCGMSCVVGIEHWHPSGSEYAQTQDTEQGNLTGHTSFVTVLNWVVFTYEPSLHTLYEQSAMNPNAAVPICSGSQCP